MNFPLAAATVPWLQTLKLNCSLYDVYAYVSELCLSSYVSCLEVYIAWRGSQSRLAMMAVQSLS